MSKSKLESLANEILIDLLENYLNGVDILIAFRNHLNYRFDTLIDECRPIRFDFESISKSNFHLCLDYISDYESIQSLNLSECDAPGRINAFLSVFPTFNQFKQLRQICLNVDGDTVEHVSMKKALRSLFERNIHTLLFKGKNTNMIFHGNHLIQGMFTLPSIRQIFFEIDMDAYSWEFLQLIPLNIEHLTIQSPVVHSRSTSRQSIVDKPSDIQPLTKLKILILTFHDNYDLITLDMLVFYFHLMPHLRHLEITDIHAQFLDAYTWQMCIQAELLFLNWFSLTTSKCYLEKRYPSHILSLFQTPFWIERKNFNVYIVVYKDLDENRIMLNSTYNCCLTIIPQRCEKDSRILLKKIISLDLDGESELLSAQYFFTNIKRLTVSNLNSSLFQWITTHIDLLRLTELRIPHLQTMTDEINSLLTYAKNVSSLMIHFRQVFNKHSAIKNVYTAVKRLDMSFAVHSFQEKHIVFLTKFFPSIEHLKINTMELNNLPLLQTYLPKLHSFTFRFSGIYSDEFVRRWNYRLGILFPGPFPFEHQWTTLWVDHATFQERWWSSSSPILSMQRTRTSARSSERTARSSEPTARVRFRVRVRDWVRDRWQASVLKFRYNRGPRSYHGKLDCL
ncbi:unnamed protein product [Adineta ricciae]|uniref:F-box domain-containing protein n=1 Tax=Adineta ricciae TaxID=249248 RepID=A0A815TWP4_ADIRI|nr:unnamed protein product [Adineta ricciae]